MGGDMRRLSRRVVAPRGSRPLAHARTQVGVQTLARVALAAIVGGSAHAAAPLPALTTAPNEASVSGLSSGGFMAVQLHVAYSGTFRRGAGIVAGGPFDCAEGSLPTALGRCTTGGAPVASLVRLTRQWAQAKSIDPVAHLAASKAYLFSGTADHRVEPAVMRDLQAYYKDFVPATNIVYKSDLAAGHGMPTDDFGVACGASESPFVNNCRFDLAGALLRHLHGPLAARNERALAGRLFEFDQTPFARSPGLAASGWAYVPKACDEGSACRVHVALHGCRQNHATVGDAFTRHAGYNRWADTNRIIVLYPQTGAESVNGCWDWWGYDGADYAKKTGPQMAAIVAMVARLGGAALPAGHAATCVTDNNFAHTVAGRAHASFGFALANGSNDVMGPWNVFASSTLKNTRAGFYVVGTCR